MVSNRFSQRGRVYRPPPSCISPPIPPVLPPVIVKLYTQSTNLQTSCNSAVGNNHDLTLGIVGSGSAGGLTVSLTYVVVDTLDLIIAAKAGDWTTSLNIIFGVINTSMRFRMQSVDPGCAITESSPYSIECTTNGVKTLTAAMSWPAGSNRARISVELKRTGGPGIPHTLFVTNDASSFLQLPT